MRKRTIIGILLPLLSLVFMGGLIILSLFLYTSPTRIFRQVDILGNGYKLNAYISEGNVAKNDWVIFIHGNRKEGQKHALYATFRNNIASDFSVLAIDLRGFGGSRADGLGSESLVINRPQDLKIAVDYLAKQYGTRPGKIILIGHSLGAAWVMRAGVDTPFRQVVPIGLGDYDSLLRNPEKIRDYIGKVLENTGVQMKPERLAEEVSRFTAKAFFSNCPESPVHLIFADYDDAREPLFPKYKTASEKCQGMVKWSVIPFSDHMYGTEITNHQKPLQRIYSRMMLSLLKYRIERILLRS